MPDFSECPYGNMLLYMRAEEAKKRPGGGLDPQPQIQHESQAPRSVVARLRVVDNIGAAPLVSPDETRSAIGSILAGKRVTAEDLRAAINSQQNNGNNNNGQQQNHQDGSNKNSNNNNNETNASVPTPARVLHAETSSTTIGADSAARGHHHHQQGGSSTNSHHHHHHGILSPHAPSLLRRSYRCVPSTEELSLWDPTRLASVTNFTVYRIDQKVEVEFCAAVDLRRLRIDDALELRPQGQIVLYPGLALPPPNVGLNVPMRVTVRGVASQTRRQLRYFTERVLRGTFVSFNPKTGVWIYDCGPYVIRPQLDGVELPEEATLRSLMGDDDDLPDDFDEDDTEDDEDYQQNNNNSMMMKNSSSRKSNSRRRNNNNQQDDDDDAEEDQSSNGDDQQEDDNNDEDNIDVDDRNLPSPLQENTGNNSRLENFAEGGAGDDDNDENRQQQDDHVSVLSPLSASSRGRELWKKVPYKLRSSAANKKASSIAAAHHLTNAANISSNFFSAAAGSMQQQQPASSTHNNNSVERETVALVASVEPYKSRSAGRHILVVSKDRSECMKNTASNSNNNNNRTSSSAIKKPDIIMGRSFRVGFNPVTGKVALPVFSQLADEISTPADNIERPGAKVTIVAPAPIVPSKISSGLETVLTTTVRKFCTTTSTSSSSSVPKIEASSLRSVVTPTTSLTSSSSAAVSTSSSSNNASTALLSQEKVTMISDALRTVIQQNNSQQQQTSSSSFAENVFWLRSLEQTADVISLVNALGGWPDADPDIAPEEVDYMITFRRRQFEQWLHKAATLDQNTESSSSSLSLEDRVLARVAARDIAGAVKVLDNAGYHNVAHVLSSCGKAFSALSPHVADPGSYLVTRTSNASTASTEQSSVSSSSELVTNHSQFTRLLHALIGSNGDFLNEPLFRSSPDAGNDSHHQQRNKSGWTWVQLLAFGIFFERPENHFSAQTAAINPEDPDFNEGNNADGHPTLRGQIRSFFQQFGTSAHTQSHSRDGFTPNYAISLFDSKIRRESGKRGRDIVHTALNHDDIRQYILRAFCEKKSLGNNNSSSSSIASSAFALQVCPDAAALHPQNSSYFAVDYTTPFFTLLLLRSLDLYRTDEWRDAEHGVIAGFVSQMLLANRVEAAMFAALCAETEKERIFFLSVICRRLTDPVSQTPTWVSQSLKIQLPAVLFDRAVRKEYDNNNTKTNAPSVQTIMSLRRAIAEFRENDGKNTAAGNANTNKKSGGMFV